MIENLVDLFGHIAVVVQDLHGNGKFQRKPWLNMYLCTGFFLLARIAMMQPFFADISDIHLCRMLGDEDY